MTNIYHVPPHECLTKSTVSLLGVSEKNVWLELNYKMTSEKCEFIL